MSKDKKEFDRFKGLLNGSQVNVLNSEDLIKALFSKAELKVKNAESIYLLHDPCDIRKPNSSELESLGKVMSLEGSVVNGYKTFNTVLINPSNKSLDLLDHQSYSTADPNYLKCETINLVQSGKLTNPLLSSKIAEGDYYNSKTIYKDSLSQSSSDLKSANPDLEITHISDREFDDISLYKLIDEDLEDYFITRLKINRNSNEERTLLTPTGKISKKVAYKKLVDKKFSTRRTQILKQLRVKNKVYQDVKRIIEWEELKLDQSLYTVVRITLIDRMGKAIFKQPMLLITNHKVENVRKAKVIYRAYLMRTKIEMVFKFCKNNLGWESFQVRDFTSIKNILALVFFIAGYFYENQKEIVKDTNCIRLAEIGGGKGKVTLHFILKGLEKMANYNATQEFIEQSQLNKKEVDLLNQIIKTRPT